MTLIRKYKELATYVFCICSFCISSYAVADKKIESDGLNVKELQTVLTPILNAEKNQSYIGEFSYKRAQYYLKQYVYRKVMEDGSDNVQIVNVSNSQGFIRVNGKTQCISEHFTGRFRVANILRPLAQDDLESLVRSYHITLLPKEIKVNNKSAKELLFLSRDDNHYSYQIAFDKQTHYPLRFVFLDHYNNIMEEGEFISFQPYPKASKSLVVPPLENCIPVKLLEAAEGQDLSKLKWRVGWLPSGIDLERITFSDASQEQLIYSDGLVDISVFIEPLVDEHMIDFQQQYGALSVISRRVTLDSGQYFVTVIGQVPFLTAIRIAYSVVDVKKM